MRLLNNWIWVRKLEKAKKNLILLADETDCNAEVLGVIENNSIKVGDRILYDFCARRIKMEEGFLIKAEDVLCVLDG